MSDYDFLDLDDVMAVHATALARHGGLDGIRDKGLLISAIEQSRSSFGGMYLHDDLFEMAAGYAFHLSQNQPFFEGNKRTGIGSAFLFLSLNGVFLEPSQDGLLFEALIAIKYPGYVDLEYEIHPDDPMPGMIKSFAYMRGVLAGIGYRGVAPAP